jgi:hypothetical protein
MFGYIYLILVSYSLLIYYEQSDTLEFIYIASCDAILFINN